MMHSVFYTILIYDSIFYLIASDQTRDQHNKPYLKKNIAFVLYFIDWLSIPFNIIVPPLWPNDNKR